MGIEMFDLDLFDTEGSGDCGPYAGKACTASLVTEPMRRPICLNVMMRLLGWLGPLDGTRMFLLTRRW